MPQVHMSGARFRIRETTLMGTIQAYTGLPTDEVRRLAMRVIEGKPVSVPLDDLDAAYNLASELTSLGINAEPDEGDY